MAPRRILLFSGAAVLVLVVLLVGALLFMKVGPGFHLGKARHLEGTNLALDVRFSYDPSMLVPAPFDSRAEYPLRLDGPGFSFYGKRIRGLGKMLAKAPAPMLYDFVGSQHMESFEQWFGLELVQDPLYEDAQIQGKLGLHQQYIYRRTAKSRGWPTYFPNCVTAAGTGDEKSETGKSVAERLAANSGSEYAYIEGWALFTADDLFFFQAVSPEELTDAQRQACLDVLNSMEFNVLLATPQPPADEESPSAPPAGDAPEEAPPQQ